MGLKDISNYLIPANSFSTIKSNSNSSGSDGSDGSGSDGSDGSDGSYGPDGSGEQQKRRSGDARMVAQLQEKGAKDITHQKYLMLGFAQLRASAHKPND